MSENNKDDKFKLPKFIFVFNAPKSFSKIFYFRNLQISIILTTIGIFLCIILNIILFFESYKKIYEILYFLVKVLLYLISFVFMVISLFKKTNIHLKITYFMIEIIFLIEFLKFLLVFILGIISIIDTENKKQVSRVWSVILFFNIPPLAILIFILLIIYTYMEYLNERSKKLISKITN